MSGSSDTPAPGRGHIPAAFVALALFAGPAAAAAQVGAFGGAPASSGTDAMPHTAPLFVESAVFPAAGEWSGGILGAMTSGNLDAMGFPEVDFTFFQSMASVFYAPSDGLVFGVVLEPYVSVEVTGFGERFDDSGMGDLTLLGRARLWQAPGGATTLAGNASFGLPIGDEGFGNESVVVGGGVALSHQLPTASLHVGAGLVIPTNDDDGNTTLNLSGAGVFAVGDRTAVAAEMLAQFADGEHSVDLIPGARFRLGARSFLEAGLLVNVAASIDQLYDYALLVGFRIGGTTPGAAR